MTEPGKSTKGYNFDDITGRIIGAAIDVHNELGPGFQEVVYQRALAMELEAAGLKASNYRVALLINFGSAKAEFRRLINERGRRCYANS